MDLITRLEWKKVEVVGKQFKTVKRTSF